MSEPPSIPSDSSSYDADFFTPLFAVEDHHFWFRSRNQVISSLVENEVLRLPAGYRVLEVGCGTGNVLRELGRVCKNGQVIGMDLFIEGLEYARRRVGQGLVQGDMHAPPFGIKFNLVGLFDVLEHLPDDQHVLDDLYTMLASGGVLLLTVPAFPSLWSYFDEASHHVRRYRLEELQSRLEQAGFKVEIASYYMMSIFPLVWVQRKLAPGRWQVQDPASEQDAHDRTVDDLKIVPVANQALVVLLGLEARWLKSGRRLPFGTSLLALGRKPD